MGFVHDLRFGVRVLVKSAGFTAAGRRDILWLVLRQGVTRIAFGSALGLVAAPRGEPQPATRLHPVDALRTE
jgi:hypothetical protein